MRYLGCKTRIGNYHDVCQDSSGYFEEGNCILIVVADGVGSAEFSQDGSRIAKDTIIKRVSEDIKKYKDMEKDDAAKKMYSNLSAYYTEALSEIKIYAEEQKHSIKDYATTLSTLIIYNDYLIWGHSGDGAIITITEDKMISELTTEQSGKYAGEVYTLFSGKEIWSFGIKENDAVACLIMTDGVLKHFKIVNSSDKVDRFYNVLISEGKANIEENKKSEELIDDLLNNRKDALDPNKDDETLGIWINYDYEFPEDQEFYYCDNRVSDANYQSSNFEEKEEELFRLIKSENNIFDDGHETILALGRYDAGICVRGMMPISMVNSLSRRDRLNELLTLVKELVADIRHYMENKGSDMVLDKVMELPIELHVQTLSNHIDSDLSVYEFKDYFMFDFNISDYMMSSGASIIELLITYRYQLAKVLSHSLILRNNNTDCKKYDTVHITEDILKKYIGEYITRSELMDIYNKKMNSTENEEIIKNADENQDSNDVENSDTTDIENENGYLEKNIGMVVISIDDKKLIENKITEIEKRIEKNDN